MLSIASSSPRKRRVPLVAGMALALFVLALDDACAGGAHGKPRQITPLPSNQLSLLDFSSLGFSDPRDILRVPPTRLLKHPDRQDAAVLAGQLDAELLGQRHAQAAHARKLERRDPYQTGAWKLERLEQSEHQARVALEQLVEQAKQAHQRAMQETQRKPKPKLKSILKQAKPTHEQAVHATQPEPKRLAVQNAAQRRDPAGKINRGRFASEERGHLSDLHDNRGTGRELRPRSLAPLKPMAAHLGAGYRDPGVQAVAQWKGTPLETASSLEAVRMAMLHIKYFNGSHDARQTEAQSTINAYIPARDDASFDDIWHNTLGLTYRPLQVHNGDVRAAIEQSIDDPSLDTAQVGSALIALPKPMRFADLPQPERIAMVIARSEPDGVSTPRYAVIGRPEPDNVNYRMAYPRWHDDGAMSMTIERLSKVGKTTLTMDRVVYVIYRPLPPS